ncbi:hypothetical protein ACFPK1_18940 [Actinomycetospora rhizophila]|uniref:Uncharacterized protein n=1 Tax=Actinomycetospora rhizophila TaxID=1416876 RepID=A0ABV9ZLG4_9PSEU
MNVATWDELGFREPRTTRDREIGDRRVTDMGRRLPSGVQVEAPAFVYAVKIECGRCGRPVAEVTRRDGEEEGRVLALRRCEHDLEPPTSEEIERAVAKAAARRRDGSAKFDGRSARLRARSACHPR